MTRSLHGTSIDELTGLPTGALFIEQLDRALRQTKQRGDSCALLVLGIDRFRTINDALGCSSGNRLLLGIADRLRSVADTVARVGGDTFGLLLERTGSEAAQRVAARVARVLMAPFCAGENTLVISASIGIAVTTDGAPERADDLLRNAELARWRAHALDRGRTVVFDPLMRAQAATAIALEQELRAASGRRSFTLLFQPIVDTRSMGPRAFEALLRWDRRSGETTLPAEFVPLAEETGLIIPIGEWAIFRACEWLTSLRRRERGAHSVKVSVNVAARQLADPEFPQRVVSAARAAHADPSSLCLELTESGLLKERETALNVLRELRDAGVEIWLDDFGTGYSSFDHLRFLDAAGLKLDKVFFEVGPEDRKRAIVEAMSRVGHSFDMSVTAEGVETLCDLAVARNAGCDMVQGFYIARPMSAEDALRYAAAHLPHTDRLEARRG